MPVITPADTQFVQTLQITRYERHLRSDGATPSGLDNTEPRARDAYTHRIGWCSVVDPNSDANMRTAGHPLVHSHLGAGPRMLHIYAQTGGLAT